MITFPDLRLIAVLSLLPISKLAHASGDPGVLYGFVAILLWHVFCGVFIYSSEKLHSHRVILGVFYLVGLVVSWIWFWNIAGPDYSKPMVIMTAWPPVMILGSLFLSKWKR